MEALNKDPSQYFGMMEEMFSTHGWRLMQEDWLQDIKDLQADALEAKSWEEVQRKRGSAEKLAELLSLETVIASQKEEWDNADI